MSEAVQEYGMALADLAQEENLEDRFRSEIREIRQIFDENPAYLRLLSSPDIPKSERTALLNEAFSASVHPYLLNFFKLTTERGYAYLLPDFLQEYERIYCERHQIVSAMAVSAIPLSEAQKQRLTEKLKAVTHQNIELTCEVDPSLIGGIRLVVNHTLFEGSIRAKLDTLRASLAACTVS